MKAAPALTIHQTIQLAFSWRRLDNGDDLFGRLFAQIGINLLGDRFGEFNVWGFVEPTPNIFEGEYLLDVHPDLWEHLT